MHACDLSLPAVHFLQGPGSQLQVLIETQRLYLRSVTAHDLDALVALFSCPKTMASYGEGCTRDATHTRNKLFDVWIPRWTQGDPKGALIVLDKTTLAFMGIVVLGNSGRPAVAELAYVIDKAHWGKRVGSEAVHAVVMHYASELRKRRFDVFEGQMVAEIEATARQDNVASRSILEKLGFEVIGTEWRHGAERLVYKRSMTM